MVNQRLARVGGAIFRRHAECFSEGEACFCTAGAQRRRGRSGQGSRIEDPRDGCLSGGAAIVVVQQASDALAAFDLARGSSRFSTRFDQAIVEA